MEWQNKQVCKLTAAFTVFITLLLLRNLLMCQIRRHKLFPDVKIPNVKIPNPENGENPEFFGIIFGISPQNKLAHLA